MAHDYSADAIVVGAGPGGLSAALYLARYLRSVQVFDAGHGRSTHHQVNRNYLGFPGGVRTTHLRELGLEQLTAYPHVQVHKHRVEHLAAAPEGGFVASGQFGTAHGRCVILATGVLDHYPHFHGWESYVGTSMFWCITCDGYESVGRKLVVAGHTNGAAGEAMQLSRLSSDITLVTNSHVDEIDDKHRERLGAAGIPVVHDKVVAGKGQDGQLEVLETESGHVLPVEAFFVVQGATPETTLAQQLGVQIAESGWIAVDTEQKTSVEGVYAAGDVTQLHSHQVTAAVHEGAQAASAANYFLYPPDLKAD